ncbi:MAG TPA: hypothetical protein VFU02_23110, partial [Polyangiaceae bacterium]|nr:hypothetical protein [Polyangiaceae bacterium]
MNPLAIAGVLLGLTLLGASPACSSKTTAGNYGGGGASATGTASVTSTAPGVDGVTGSSMTGAGTLTGSGGTATATSSGT